MDMDHSAVFRVAFAADQSIAFKVIDHGRHIAAAFQYLCAYFTLCQMSQDDISFQHGELGIREVTKVLRSASRAKQRVGTARQFDEGIEGAHLCAGTVKWVGISNLFRRQIVRYRNIIAMKRKSQVVRAYTFG